MRNTLIAVNATKHSDKHYTASGLEIYKDVIFPENNTIWAWKINGQYFSRDDWASEFLIRRIAEIKTGVRIINRERGSAPEICGNEGSYCRAKIRGYFTMLCSYCPIAEQIEADRDKVKIKYQP